MDQSSEALTTFAALAGFGGFFIIVLLLGLWAFVWKALALWHSARNKQFGWFIILLFVNTLGILEIIYLFGVLKLRGNELFKK